MLLRGRNSRDDFSTRVNYIDAQRQTQTNLDVLQEATIDDYWNMDGEKSLSEPWIGVTRFAQLNKMAPEGFLWVQGRMTTRPGNFWPEEWSNTEKNFKYPSLIEPTNVTNCPKQVHQSEPNHRRVEQLNHGKVIGNFMGGGIRQAVAT